METTFHDYVLEATGDTLRGIARRLGMVTSTLRRQVIHETPLTVETVVTICREYALPLGPAFVLAGFVTIEEVAGMNGRTSLAAFTDSELAGEVFRRVSTGEAVVTPTVQNDDPWALLPRDQAGADRALAEIQGSKRKSS